MAPHGVQILRLPTARASGTAVEQKVRRPAPALRVPYIRPRGFSAHGQICAVVQRPHGAAAACRAPRPWKTTGACLYRNKGGVGNLRSL